eukprot:SM000044S15985  [mRNA]  locus=s44:412050:413691:+ [translate_table: standard]
MPASRGTGGQDNGGIATAAAGASEGIDLSPSATTAAFDPVLPLLRVPVPAGPGDDPDKGPYVLAFRDVDSWRRAWAHCEQKIALQCERLTAINMAHAHHPPQAGTRMGCSLAATSRCRTPWWRAALPRLLGRGAVNAEDKEREACEEAEMLACLADSHSRCSKHARESCDPVFSDLRIADSLDLVIPKFLDKSLQQALAPGQAKTPRRVATGDSTVGTAAAANQSSGANPSPQAQRAGLHSGWHSLDQNIWEEEEPPSGRVSNIRSSRHLAQRDAGPSVWHMPGRGDANHTSGSFSGGADFAEPHQGWEGGLIRPKASRARSTGPAA